MNIACQNCPARLLNKDKVIFNDIGNSIANAMFVIPQHNEDAVNDIIRIYNRASNKVFEEHCLLSCAVKCKLGNDYKVFDSSVIQCKRIFFEVWRFGYYRHTFVFGDAYRLFYDAKPNTNDVDFVLDNLDYHLHFYPSLGIKHYNVDKYNSLLRRLSNDIVTYNV